LVVYNVGADGSFDSIDNGRVAGFKGCCRNTGKIITYRMNRNTSGQQAAHDY